LKLVACKKILPSIINSMEIGDMLKKMLVHSAWTPHKQKQM
jgi:hypothetical protein